MKMTYKVNKKLIFRLPWYTTNTCVITISSTHKFVENVSTNTLPCLHDQNLKFNPLNIIQLEGRRKYAIF